MQSDLLCHQEHTHRRVCYFRKVILEFVHARGPWRDACQKDLDSRDRCSFIKCTTQARAHW